MPVTVRIVADSACDLPASMRDRLGIAVVPTGLTFGSQTLRDGVDITAEGVLERVRAGEIPKFSQPPSGDFFAAYHRLGTDPATGRPRPGLSIVSIHVTAKLSGTANSALLAARLLPDLDIRVVDSRTGSMGAGFVACQAARLAGCGATVAEVMDLVESALLKTAFFLVVPDLMHLYRAGRLGRAEAWLGHTLGLMPVVSVRDGVVAPYRLMRGRAQGLKACLAAAVARFGRDVPVDVAVVHVGAEEDAHSLLGRATMAFSVREGLVVHAGATVSAALGPGTVGLCVCRAPGCG